LESLNGHRLADTIVWDSCRSVASGSKKYLRSMA
jgi:hypothetical protein